VEYRSSRLESAPGRVEGEAIVAKVVREFGEGKKECAMVLVLVTFKVTVARVLRTSIASNGS
jgi:hypothetical protein